MFDFQKFDHVLGLQLNLLFTHMKRKTRAQGTKNTFIQLGSELHNRLWSLPDSGAELRGLRCIRLESMIRSLPCNGRSDRGFGVTSDPYLSKLPLTCGFLQEKEPERVKCNFSGK